MNAKQAQEVKIFTAGLVVTRHKKLLLAFSSNKQAWYLPGGKIDEDETATDALVREVKEELNTGLDKTQLQFYIHITAPAFGEKDGSIMEQDCFLYELPHEPGAGAEIAALQYFDTAAYCLEPKQVPGVVMIMRQLKEDGMID